MIIHVDIPSLKALKIVISSLLCQAFEKAALGGSLDKVIAVAQKAIDNTRSIGVGLTGFLPPGNRTFSYDILQDTKINVHRSYVGNYFTSL